MDKQAAIDKLRSILTECSGDDARAVEDILRLGAGDLGLPAGVGLADPSWLPSARRHAYQTLRETIEHHSEGEEFFRARAGSWEHVLLTLVVEGTWEQIRLIAATVRLEHAQDVIRRVVDILDNSRHAFRSKQIQQARELLETLL